MKILIWVIVALVVVGGLVWFLSSDTTESVNTPEDQNNIEDISENNNIIDTDSAVFDEIDDALGTLE